MADNKIRMPSSQGGLVSFSGESRSKFELSPLHTVFMILAVIMIVLLMHVYASGIFL